MIAALFGVAAGSGALLRWQAGRLLPRPLATLGVNLVGAFALGLLSNATDPLMTVAGVGASERSPPSPPWPTTSGSCGPPAGQSRSPPRQPRWLWDSPQPGQDWPPRPRRFAAQPVTG